MFASGFWYRRLGRFFPLVFSQVGAGGLSVRNKYEIASVRDVFMSAHYWRLFEHLPPEPALVVDLGAHCGHFSALCHLAILERHGKDAAQYILVEPLARLIPSIRRTVREIGFEKHVVVEQALVGKKEGNAFFKAPSENLLAARVAPDRSGALGEPLPYRDLNELVPAGRRIDILKIDIEGSEYDLLKNYPSLVGAARRLLIEVHGPVEIMDAFEKNLAALGLAPLSPAIVREHERLLFYGSSD